MVGMKSRDKARRGTSVPPLAGPPEHDPADADAAEETDTIKHWWATIGSNTADAASHDSHGGGPILLMMVKWKGTCL